MKKIIAVFVFFTIAQSSFSQFFGGLAYGTFKVPGTSLKGYGPTVCFAYTGRQDRMQTFLDASLYKKEEHGSRSIYDTEENYIGTATTTWQSTIAHFQLGFKASLAGDFTYTKLNYFLGGGFAGSLINNRAKYHLAGYTIPDDNLNHMTYGFHFNTGGQWRIKPVILQLQGNFDLVLKPITTEADAVSNILTSLRLGVLIPIVK